MAVGPPKDVFTGLIPGSPSVGPPLDVFASPESESGSGTVTSVDVSGGTTGLTTTGGPVTTAGTITLHLPNNVQISGRNALDNADIGLIGTNASDQITLSDFGLMDPVIKSLTITSTTNAVDRGLVSYEASPSDLGSMFVGKRAGGSPGSPSIVPANTAIANYAALAYDGVIWLRTGIMQFAADTPTAVGSIPTSWELYLSDGSTDAIGTTPQVTCMDTGAFNFNTGMSYPISTVNTTPYAVAVTDYTLLVDTTGGNITVNLPASPTTGRTLNIKKIAAGNTLTIGHNGKNIDGAASNLTVTVSMQAVTLQYSATFGWAIL